MHVVHVQRAEQDLPSTICISFFIVLSSGQVAKLHTEIATSMMEAALPFKTLFRAVANGMGLADDVLKFCVDHASLPS